MAFDPEKLKTLSPEVRKRVEDALTSTIEKELAATTVASEPQVAAHSRSRGAIFSRSRTSLDALRDRPAEDLDRSIVTKLDTMDDVAFDKFAARLTTLKKIGK
jgi:hypothetical protein